MIGRCAIVTGAASGMGLAVAERLLGQCWTVVCVDLDGEVLRERLDRFPTARYVVGDVSDPSTAQEYVQLALRCTGKVDGFFNNAGVEGDHKPLTEMATEDWKRTLAINLDGAFFGMRAVIPAMREHGGSIVNTGSVLSLTGAPSASAYAASKHAILGLTRCVAAEEAGSGIRVNCICPGPIDTPLQRRAEANVDPKSPERARAWFTSMLPVGRYGTPGEIAELVSFLLAPETSFITGIGIAIDGGMSCAL